MKTKEKHLNDDVLAQRWGIPVKAVPEVKKIYGLHEIYPLTQDILDISTSFTNFLPEAQKIASQFIAKEKVSEAVRKGRKKTFDSETYITVSEIQEALNLSAPEFKFAKKSGLLSPGKGQLFYRDYIEAIDIKKLHLCLAEEFDKENKMIQGAGKEIEERKQSIRENIRVTIRDRNSAPLSTTFYFGPTNSGKTYHALQALCSEYELDSEGIYVYAGPLRMLAFEVYLKMVERYGEASVGFITGDEVINPEARLLAVTTEMAPLEGASLVIDESHWIADEHRGDHWTQLLIGGKYTSFHIAAAQEAEETLKELMSDSYQMFTNFYTRRTPISFEGLISINALPKKTAVICFSRKSVYAVAQELSKKGYKTGVLYGALPLSVRKQQIDLFIAGEYDVIVTTDVIGHGINLPIDNVVFTQTEKFDGVNRRELMRWETAQIAGRAGRFGLSEQGRVYVLEGVNANVTTVHEGTLCAAGILAADLDIKSAVLTPKKTDLGLADDEQIMLNFALHSWQDKAVSILAGRNIKPSTLRSSLVNLGMVANCMKYYLNPWDTFGDKYEHEGIIMTDVRKKTYYWKIPMDELWGLINGPFNPKTGVLEALCPWLATNNRNNSPLMKNFFDSITRQDKMNTVDDLEVCIARISELKMSAIMFAVEGKLGTLKIDSIRKAEIFCEEKLARKLQEEINESNAAK